MGHGFETTGFHDGLIILGAAGLVIPVFARFRISPIIGFILVGILVGPGGLGQLSDEYPWLHHVTISNAESVQPFAELGIILLLFGIGLELSFRRLWSMRRLVFGVGAAELIGCALILGLFVQLFGASWSGSVALGLALALSSTALALPLVGTAGPVGRSALAMLLFEDLAIVPIIFLLGAMAPYAQAEGWSGLATTLLLGGLTIVAMLLLGRILLPGVFAQAARTKSPEHFLAASLLVVIAASLATALVGLSPIMGALIAGVLIAETDYQDEVEVVTAPFRGLALGVFLITVGMSIDLRGIFADWQMLAAAVGGVILIKTLVTGALLRLAGSRREVAAETSVLMASPSETTLIVLGAASAAQLIQPQQAAFWQTVTAVGLTITPLLAYAGRSVGRKIARRELLETEDSFLEGSKVVVLGFGRVGRMVVDMLTAHGKDYVAVDADTDTVAAARREGYHVIFGDVARPELIDRVRARNTGAFILTMDNPVLANRVAARLRSSFPKVPIVARARDAKHAAKLYRAGVTDAVPETLESSLQLAEAALVDIGVAMGPVIASIHEKRSELRAQIMTEAQLLEEPRLGRRQLRDSAPRQQA